MFLWKRSGFLCYWALVLQGGYTSRVEVPSTLFFLFKERSCIWFNRCSSIATLIRSSNFIWSRFSDGTWQAFTAYTVVPLREQNTKHPSPDRELAGAGSIVMAKKKERERKKKWKMENGNLLEHLFDFSMSSWWWVQQIDGKWKKNKVFFFRGFQIFSTRVLMVAILVIRESRDRSTTSLKEVPPTARVWMSKSEPPELLSWPHGVWLMFPGYCCSLVVVAAIFVTWTRS